MAEFSLSTSNLSPKKRASFKRFKTFLNIGVAALAHYWLIELKRSDASDDKWKYNFTVFYTTGSRDRYISLVRRALIRVKELFAC